jgi:small-conductance mechanosensitive channel
MEAILQYKIFSVGSYALTVTMVLGVLLTWFLAWLLLRAIRRILNRSERLLNLSDQGRRLSVYLITQYVVWTVAAAIMLEVVGIHVSVVLAGSAALLVGLGLGVQQIFRDIMSGIFLLFEGTVEIGDIIEMDGRVGKITEINLRTSKILNRDGTVMIVPNHKFITENVLNWTHHEQMPGRFSITVGTDYAAAEDRVRDILLDCAMQHPDVLQDDPDRRPSARLLDFTDERIIFELQFWTHRKFESDTVRGDLRFAIRARLRAEGIGMAKS